MRWIIGSSLKFRYLVVAFAVVLMVYGAGQVRDARTDAFPEFAPPRVEVQTICLGLSSEETEELVTVPLEQALDGVARLDEIRSASVPQLSSIELTGLGARVAVARKHLHGHRPAGAAGARRRSVRFGSRWIAFRTCFFFRLLPRIGKGVP